jgi:hypothetical protein
MRSSVDKLTRKLSKDSQLNKSSELVLYARQKTVGVVVSKTMGKEHVFIVSGDDNDYRNTGLEDRNQPILISVGTSLSL